MAKRKHRPKMVAFGGAPTAGADVRAGGGMASARDASDNVEVAERDGRWVIAFHGRLTAATAGRAYARLRKLGPAPAASARIDLSELEALDTAGAWLVDRLRRRLEQEGHAVEVVGARPDHATLVALMEGTSGSEPPVLKKPNAALAIVAQMGEQAIARWQDATMLTAFFGLVAITLARSIVRPGHIRYVSLVHHMQQAGLNAIPITALLSMLIGVVLAYQGAFQLERFGASIFTVNLIGISVLREIGVLMTSIVIAGRSGSAFTAQIGTMKVNQEVDAMYTLGLDPIEVLVVPRLLALMLTLPLLVFFADMMGLLGGGLMCLLVLDISPTQYINQLHAAIGPWTFWVGIIKAPVFAFVIGMVGCFEGMQVSGSAESVGKLTTKSVVESIFLVILLDALFSVLFAQLGL